MEKKEKCFLLLEDLLSYPGYFPTSVCIISTSLILLQPITLPSAHPNPRIHLSFLPSPSTNPINIYRVPPISQAL